MKSRWAFRFGLGLAMWSALCAFERPFRGFSGVSLSTRFRNYGFTSCNRSLTVAARTGAFPSRDREGAVALEYVTELPKRCTKLKSNG